jgi:hypothetical protein
MIAAIFRKILLSTAFASMLVANPASAEVVKLSENPYDPARSIINVVFGNYLAGLTGVNVQSAIVNLDGDRNGEIIARFVHSSACREATKSCRTVLLRHMSGQWTIILDRFADSIEVGRGYRDVPAPIKVDGKAWDWDGKRYLPEVAELGTPVDMKPVSDAAKATLSAAFGQSSKLEAAGFPLSYKFTESGLSKNNDLMLVKMEGSSVCGKLNGCPVRILKKEGESWKPVLSSATTGDVYLSSMSRDGYKDIILETKDGALQLGWTGSAYAVADRIEGASK